jgi:hypothetical protein
MVLALFRGMHHLNPQYSTVNAKEAKYTLLEYKTKLKRMHTLDSPFSISFFKEQSFNNTGPQVRK